MKRIGTLFLCLVLLLSAAVPSAFAAEEETNQTVEYLEDGSYIVTEITQQTLPGARMITTVGSKTKSFYNTDGVLRWKMTVTGEFLYDGKTSSCTYASGVTTVFDHDHWEVTNESTSASGNTASYSVTFARWSLGVVISRPTYNVSLSCDRDGNLS